jgi:hypothetical protein
MPHEILEGKNNESTHTCENDRKKNLFGSQPKDYGGLRFG